MTDNQIVDLSPYKGYCPSIKSCDGWSKGHAISLTQTVITFESRTADARQAFCDLVDRYLRECEVRGVEPERPG